MGLLRSLAAACIAAFALTAHAQQNPLRTLPKDAKTGSLTHVVENVFTLNGTRVLLAPGGIVRGTNNMILTPVMVPRESLVSYLLDADGQIARAWLLTRDEAAKANFGVRYTWQTSPETGTPIGAILGTSTAQQGIAQPGQRGEAPGFMQVRPVTEAAPPASDQPQ